MSSLDHTVLADLNPRSPLLWILVAALAIRIAAIEPLHAGGYTSDEREYIELGEKLSRGEPFVDSNGERSTRSPLFPMMLAGLFMVGGTSLSLSHGLGAVLGTMTVLAGYALSVRFFKDRRAALATAVALAVYPGLVIYSALLQTESLYLVFFLGSFVLGLQLVDEPKIIGGIMLGLISGLAALTRSVFLGFFPFLLIVLWTLGRDRGISLRGPLTASLIAFAVVLFPWTARNYSLHGSLVPISSFGGRSLLVGNNPYATATWSAQPGFEKWLDQELVKRGLPVHEKMQEVPLGHASTQIALSYIMENPGDWVILLLMKAHVFSVYPITNSDSNIPLQAVAVLADIPLLVVASIGLVVMWPERRRLIPLLAAILFFFLLHVFLHAESRYRLPLVPLFMLFFGTGLVLLGKSGGLSKHLPTQRMRTSVAVVVAIIMGVYAYTGMLFLQGKI